MMLWAGDDTQSRLGWSYDVRVNLGLALGPPTPESPEEHVKKTYFRVSPQSN